MTGQRLRPGGSWTAKAGDDPNALVTLVEYDPAETPDGKGRRPSDRLVGMARGRDRAVAWCMAVNDVADLEGR